MATSWKANKLLLTVVSTLALFLVFVAVSKVSALGNYAYAPAFGWHTAQSSQSGGVCDRPIEAKGFPITTLRPAPNDPSGCLDETNQLAGYVNVALCFAAAAILSVGEVSIITKD